MSNERHGGPWDASRVVSGINKLNIDRPNTSKQWHGHGQTRNGLDSGQWSRNGGATVCGKRYLARDRLAHWLSAHHGFNHPGAWGFSGRKLATRVFRSTLGPGPVRHSITRFAAIVRGLAMVYLTSTGAAYRLCFTRVSLRGFVLAPYFIIRARMDGEWKGPRRKRLPFPDASRPPNSFGLPNAAAQTSTAMRFVRR